MIIPIRHLYWCRIRWSVPAWAACEAHCCRPHTLSFSSISWWFGMCPPCRRNNSFLWDPPQIRPTRFRVICWRFTFLRSTVIGGVRFWWSRIIRICVMRCWSWFSSSTIDDVSPLLHSWAVRVNASIWPPPPAASLDHSCIPCFRREDVISLSLNPCSRPRDQRS